MRVFFRGLILAGSVTVRLETGKPPGLRFVAIHRKCLVTAPSGVGNVINATADRPFAPPVVDIEGQRRVDRTWR